MNHGWIYREQVGRSAAGLTVLEYYTQRYGHSTEAEWQARIASGQILLDGNSVAIATPLNAGQVLTYHRPPWHEPDVPLNVSVLYEDAELLVVAKPAGMPVLPGGGFLEHTLLGQLRSHNSHDSPVPIHRLGRGTSGLLLLARSALAKSHLTAQMRNRQIRKVYRALVGQGDVGDRFSITHVIGKIPHPVLGYVYGATADGKFAQSDCQVIRRNSETTLLEVTILTGRPHQIRIHLAAAGYPLVGDPLYDIGGIPRQLPATPDGRIPVPGDCGYHLHAYHLSFTHPRTGQGMTITCPPPEDLE